jgi:hypothetical protein
MNKANFFNQCRKMDRTLIGYFLKRISFYCSDFVSAYFKGGYSILFRIYQNYFSRIERSTGLIVNIRYFTIPLWQQYSFAAYLISIPYRTIRIIFGGVILTMLTLLFSALYLLWIFLPFYFILKTVASL